MSDPKQNSEGWFDRSENVDKLIRVLYVLCGISVLAEFGVHMHPHFDIEKIPAFYAVLGFVAFVLIVRAGEQFRKVIMREKGFYDE